MDRNIQNALSILEELLTERGIFQCQIDFSSSQAMIWTIDDPLRIVDTTIYLRTASINIFNAMVSLTFSCDGSHYMRFDEFLAKGPAFWSGVPAWSPGCPLPE